MASLARWYFYPEAGRNSPYLTFYLPIAFVCWFGGLGSALLAIFLSSFGIAYFFLEPFASFAIADPRDQVWHSLYVRTTLFIVLLQDAEQRAQRRSEAHAQIAEDRLRRLEEETAQRLEAEEKRRETEAKYRRIVETTLEGVWIVDSESRTNFANERFASILG